MPNYVEKRDLSWVPDAERLLRDEGLSYAEVGRRVDRKRDTVRGHLPGYGRYSEHFSWKPAALEMLRDDMPYREVGRTLGVDFNHIRKAYPGYGASKEDAAELRKANAILSRL